MKFFGVKYFMKYFVIYVWNISKISRWTTDAGCIVHCNKVSKPVMLLCMNSIMYFLLTSYTLIMFKKKVLSHFIMKIEIFKNFMKFFNEGVLKYFKISMKFLNISKWNIWSCIPTWYATEYDFDVKQGDAGELPFRIRNDFEGLSLLIDYLTEREIHANHLLKSHTKQANSYIKLSSLMRLTIGLHNLQHTPEPAQASVSLPR